MPDISQAISRTTSPMKALVRLSLALVAVSAFAQEITLEEVKVEAVYVSPSELPLNKSIDQMIERLRLNDEHARTIDLRNAHQSSLTTLIDLTRYSPIPLGNDPRIDAFTQENYMRADLNPRESKSIFGGK